MATLDEVKEAIAELSFRFPHYAPPDGDWERDFRSYHRSWKDIPGDVLEVATQMHLDTGTWFPKPGELRRIAEGVRGMVERGEPVLTVFERDAQRDQKAIMAEYDRVLRRLFTDHTMTLEQVTGEGWVELWNPYRRMHDALGVEYPLIDISDLEIVEMED